MDFQIDGAEFALYRDVTRFVKRESARAAAESEDPRARAIGFLMSLYQRRLASSTYAMRRSLENRARRLEDGLERAQDLVRKAPPDLPDPEELEEMEESERDRLEALLEAITLAGSADLVRREIHELRRLVVQAQAVEEAGTEAKLSKLNVLLHQEGFFDHADQRLLLFTEFKDTLDYLMGRLRSWGFRVGCIHGGIKGGSRDEPGTRLHAEQQFRDGEIQILVATEAAGEGINLQACHILFNYDIHWNPNRLEQRMGRIHRYGQHKEPLAKRVIGRVFPCRRRRGEGRSAGGMQRSQDGSDRAREAGDTGVHGACLPVMRASAREERWRISFTSRSSLRLFSIHSR